MLSIIQKLDLQINLFLSSLDFSAFRIRYRRKGLSPLYCVAILLKRRKVMTPTKTQISLDGLSLAFDDLSLIAQGAPLKIAETAKARVESSRRFVEQEMQSGRPIYAINTGFGYLANTPIPEENRNELQHNILKSHAAGFGTPLSPEETRLAMVLRLNVLLKGNTGVRFVLCEQLFRLLQANILPLIPAHGSVGASGDLAPLAHLALPIIGEGKVLYKGKEMPARAALDAAGIAPLSLEAKEGLSLINGTQVMLSIGGLALHSALELLRRAERITALSFEGMNALPQALDPLIHKARGQEGQKTSAEAILAELEGSSLLGERGRTSRVQDPYSLRCAPQIHGPSRDALGFARQLVERELNAATDNPLVFPEEGKIISGGNFHGQVLAMAFDTATMAVAELASVSERRLELLLNPHFNELSAFLVKREGLDSGYMAAQYLSASLVNENKVLSHPACTDSIPGNVGVEDHVSMGMCSVRKFRKVVENAYVVLSVEALAAAQAVDLRGRTEDLGRGTRQAYEQLRQLVPTYETDRWVHEDVDAAVKVMYSLT